MHPALQPLSYQATMHCMANRRVSIIGYDGVQILDVTGPGEVFSIANRYLGPAQRPYEVELVARRRGEVVASGGLRMLATRSLKDLTDVDTLIVPGGDGVEHALGDAQLARTIAETSARARRTASVCSGAFLLAAAGLLDGRRATTHWSVCDLLADLCPTTRIEPDAIYVRDGTVSTSAGITAGIDLALAFVEEDHGREIAARVARQLVVFLRRPGGQSQFSVHLDTHLAERGSVRDAQAWIANHLDSDLSVATLAAESGMSVRNFSRVFRHEVGVTPAEYVEAARVEAVKQLLETTSASLTEIARTCGYRSIETLHRVFKKHTGVTPGQFRRRFQPSVPDAAEVMAG